MSLYHQGPHQDILNEALPIKASMQPGELQTFEGPREFGYRQPTAVFASVSTPPQQISFRLEHEKAAPVRAYPSPPMSRSSPSPQQAQDAIEHRYGPSDYPNNPQYARGGAPIHQPLSEPSSQPSEHFGRPYPPPEHIDRMPYGYQRPAEYPSRPLSYPGPSQMGVSPNVAQQPYTSMAGPGSTTAAFPMTSTAIEIQPLTSPKSQRKIKGHVASACVPCKRAHLRCDAQRPCSRCTSNGKEDACIDVQHKKRGRPRLRDDREARYDLSRPPPPHDTGLRRPLSMYSSTSMPSIGYDAPIQHEDPYRAIKSQANEPLSSYSDRGLRSGSEAAAYGQPASLQSRYSGAVAYLSLDLEVARASETFVEALAGLRPERRHLVDLVVPAERDRIVELQQRLVAEQKQREPNYLPPILGRGNQVFQTLGFTVEDVSRYRLDREDCFTFIGHDGRLRQYFVRLGLAMEGSFYFAVLLLTGPPRDRTAPQTYYPSGPPQAAPPQLQDRRLSEATYPPRPGPHLPPALNPSMHSRGSSFAASPLSEHPPFPYGAPRSEVGSQPSSQGSFQLPPIRPPPEGRHDMQSRPTQTQQPQYPPRDERSSRVDIGGLIEKPEGTGHPR